MSFGDSGANGAATAENGRLASGGIPGGSLLGRRAVLEKLPFPLGYGVEIARLIDNWHPAVPIVLAQTNLVGHDGA